MSHILIQRLGVAYGPPDFSVDPDAYLAELVRLTAGYATAELDKAADLLLRDFRPNYRNPWPSPNAICLACADARELTQPPRVTTDRNPDWSRPAIAKAYQLIVSDVGRLAADQGWILGLWDFCRKHGRLPNAGEIHTCRADARGFDEAFGSASTPGRPVYASLVKLGESMLRRRDRLARLAHGEIIIDAAGIVPEGDAR